MKFKPSKAKLSKAKRSEILLAVLFLTDSYRHHFPVKNCQVKKCWSWVMLWDGVTSLHHLLPFIIPDQFCHFDGNFQWQWLSVGQNLSLPTARRHFHTLISQNPHNPKLLFFSWHVGEWAARSFFSEQLESAIIPLCQKLMGLVFANLIERIHATIWALFV